MLDSFFCYCVKLIVFVQIKFKQNLEEKDKKHQTTKDQLLREQKYLRERLDQLQDGSGSPPPNFTIQHSIHKRRSISECSSGVSSSSSNGSEPDTSETNDIFDSPDNGVWYNLIHNLRIFINN